MKKNKMLRTASVLLILVMLTTSIVGGTFAKYTTTGTASDTARVAKWGVVVTTSGSLFSDAYAEANVTGGNLPAEWDATKISNNEITVATKNAGEKNIVAPGTKNEGSGLTFSISGTPEVATKISGEIKARDIYLDTSKSYGVMVPVEVTEKNWAELKASGKLYEKNATGNTYTKKDSGDLPSSIASSTVYYLLHDATTAGAADSAYYPVVYSLASTGGATSVTGNTSASSTAAVAKELLQAMKAGYDGLGTLELDGVTKKYTVGADDTGITVIAANTSLADNNPFVGKTISWKWDYSSDTETDAKDTILGNMITAAGTGNGFNPIDNTAADADQSFVVYKGTGDFTDVYYDSDNMLARTAADGDILASLETHFEISLTVTQVD